MPHALSQSVIQLSHNIDRLCEKMKAFGFRSPEHDAWYELLNRKVTRQLSKRPFLVVAIMGGTNTGKSVVFNHLAGERASAADHRAAGTKHPVCLIPPSITSQTQSDGFEEETAEEILRRHFNLFHILPWSQAQDPLQKDEEHLLFWRTGENVPPKLLLLDTPDIDSDAQVNWERARAVREASDLILAVLTEQKYADAAVKRFFREATAAGKPVILLFNMVDVENDLAEVPRWIKQFHEETGTNPTDVIVAPHNRDAAGDLTLPFERWELDSDIDNADSGEPKIERSPQNLTELIARLHFEKIKLQTIVGALRVICDEENGLPRFLESIRSESKSWGNARKTLENAEGIEISWPTLPTPMLIEEIRSWWEQGRPAWSRNIHNAYRTLGKTLLWPVKKSWNALKNQTEKDPFADFQKLESETVTRIVEQTIEQLERLAQTENPVLKSAIEELLTGENRKNLLEHAKAAHQSLVPIDDGFRDMLRERLQSWSEENPKSMKLMRSLDCVAAVARPAVTVTLATTGFFFIAAPLGHVVLEAAITGGVTGTGEVLVNQTGEGIKRSVAKFFQSVQEEYAQNRAKHFFQWFQREIWGSLLTRLEQGERIPESTQFLDVQKAFEMVTEKYEQLSKQAQET